MWLTKKISLLHLLSIHKRHTQLCNLRAYLLLLERCARLSSLRLLFLNRGNCFLYFGGFVFLTGEGCEIDEGSKEFGLAVWNIRSSFRRSIDSSTIHVHQLLACPQHFCKLKYLVLLDLTARGCLLLLGRHDGWNLKWARWGFWVGSKPARNAMSTWRSSQ